MRCPLCLGLYALCLAGCAGLAVLSLIAPAW